MKKYLIYILFSCYFSLQSKNIFQIDGTDYTRPGAWRNIIQQHAQRKLEKQKFDTIVAFILSGRFACLPIFEKDILTSEQIDRAILEWVRAHHISSFVPIPNFRLVTMFRSAFDAIVIKE